MNKIPKIPKTLVIPKKHFIQDIKNIVRDTTIMQYPKLPFELDRRKKLTKSDIIRIWELEKLGFSLREIGRKFGVNKNTIKYHLDDWYRAQVNRNRYALLKQQKKNNPIWAKAQRKRNNALFLENTKRYEPLRIYKGKNTYKWKKRKYHSDKHFREKYKEQAKIYYRKKKARK